MATTKTKAKSKPKTAPPKPPTNAQKLGMALKLVTEVTDNPGKMSHANFLRVKVAAKNLKRAGAR